MSPEKQDAVAGAPFIGINKDKDVSKECAPVYMFYGESSLERYMVIIAPAFVVCPACSIY